MVAQEPNAIDRHLAIRDYVLAALPLAAIYVVYVLVVSPRHEFPLMDDWAYAQTVRHLLDTGQLRISEWASTTLIFQVYWGALFARLFGGFSFTALRWSTFVFSFITSLALYALLRQLDLGAAAAWLGSLTLVVNPIFVYLSYTFMSDVFYIGLMLLSLAFYVRGIRRDAGLNVIYIPFYLPTSEPRYGFSDDVLFDEYTAMLKLINPAFEPGWVKERRVFRAPYAQPVCIANFADLRPDPRAPVRGLYVTDSTQFYPEDRTVSAAIQLGREVAHMVTAETE